MYLIIYKKRSDNGEWLQQYLISRVGKDFHCITDVGLFWVGPFQVLLGPFGGTDELCVQQQIDFNFGPLTTKLKPSYN